MSAYPVTPGMFVGSLDMCELWTGPILHATPTCWQPNLGELVRVDDDNLWLNMVDAREAKYFSLGMFRDALRWIDAHPDNLLIHCDQGVSRSASLAMLWLARRDALTWLQACEAYPGVYRPGQGIRLFLDAHWDDLAQITESEQRLLAGDR